MHLSSASYILNYVSYFTCIIQFHPYKHGIILTTIFQVCSKTLETS